MEWKKYSEHMTAIAVRSKDLEGSGVCRWLYGLTVIRALTVLYIIIGKYIVS
jgi:hypothetical protein